MILSYPYFVMSDDESKYKERIENENAQKNKVGRRQWVKTTTGVALTSVVGFTGTASAKPDPETAKKQGSYEEGGGETSIDLSIVDMTGSAWDGKDMEVLNGMYEGFSILYNELNLFDGFRIRLYDVNEVYDGEDDWDPLKQALDEHGFDGPGHYHVLYDGEFNIIGDDIGSFHKVENSNTKIKWSHEKAISALSMATTAATPLADAYVRGLHQAMHTYIDRDIAEYYSDATGYDAVHALGTATTHDGKGRSIMADTYPHRSSEGTCDGGTGSSPEAGNLYFSDCAINTVRGSISKAIRN